MQGGAQGVGAQTLAAAGDFEASQAQGGAAGGDYKQYVDYQMFIKGGGAGGDYKQYMDYLKYIHGLPEVHEGWLSGWWCWWRVQVHGLLEVAEERGSREEIFTRRCGVDTKVLREVESPSRKPIVKHMAPGAC